MEELIQSIADNARHRYDCLDDSEIIANTLIDLNDVLQATQGSYFQMGTQRAYAND